ncbi:MAG: M15 family metallopeptidase [Lachnospiraceae bacterium]|nr:M15 family metallopeptidase [Lachnospiraceae bacterium]
MSIAKKHRVLTLPCLAVMTVILIIYHICMHFATNGKRYVGIALSLLFFVSSCSFSFAVFTGQSGFIKTQESYNEVVAYSDVELAAEVEVEPDDSLLESDEGTWKEDESSEYTGDEGAYTLDDILESSEHYAVGDKNQDNDPEAAENGTGAEETPVFDSSDWRLILINKQHPIPDDYSFELGSIKGNMKCDERIITDLLDMMHAAKSDGYNLMIKSPYRTDDRQENNFNERIKSYMKQGYSYMDAYKATSRVITIPGSSEHQVGLAIDITSDTYPDLKQGFGETEAGKWLEEHSCEYGFIVRYPENKEYITSIDYEPWHFRYVGKDAATIIMQEGICLEEFWDKYL